MAVPSDSASGTGAAIGRAGDRLFERPVFKQRRDSASNSAILDLRLFLIDLFYEQSAAGCRALIG